VIVYRADGSQGKVGEVKIAYLTKEHAARAVIEQMAQGWFPFVYDERPRCTFDMPEIGEKVLSSEIFDINE